MRIGSLSAAKRIPSRATASGTPSTSNKTLAGRITAIRFWKAAGETGQHVGRIWSTTGQLLTSVAFVNETSSGWQQQDLPSALTIPANTEFIVSVNTTNNLFVGTISGLATGLIQGSLRAPSGTNGVFSYTAGTFPTSTYSSTNYFRDIVFAP